MSITAGRKIDSITVVSGTGVSRYYLGGFVNGMEIAEIVNNGIEFPDSITFIYKCLDKTGKLIVEIDNCPVVVEYREEG